MNTAVFLGDVPPQEAEAAGDDDEEWPPFRKVRKLIVVAR